MQLISQTSSVQDDNKHYQPQMKAIPGLMILSSPPIAFKKLKTLADVKSYFNIKTKVNYEEMQRTLKARICE